MNYANIGKILASIGGFVVVCANIPIIDTWQLKDLCLSGGAFILAVSTYLIGHMVVKNGNK